MKYTAIVPARSGSKRLPGKNIKMLLGKPLLVWTLEACIESKHIDHVILSTDSMDYFKLARRYINSDKLTLDYRELAEADDKVKIFDYIKEKKQKIFGQREGAFILALPTVPLRKTNHIDEAIALYEKKGKPVFSATKYKFPLSFAFSINDDGWKSIFSDCPMINGNTRSQDQNDYFHPNGAIYIRSIKSLEDDNLVTLYSGAYPYIMDNIDSVDVDNEIDFRVAEAILSSKT
ncbi:MAG: acylneuraminate cytidylyltransferase family protein [gamma proteobacterium symbiont of Lucinoma myriamae]|nr:acylneuraminate cytidylyltransferase family protein [gamma proteobacterium symbiont of Lucinoma myriamae]MCU7819646.1 acylneuraminate cytidylyltransferase family protein [gamma proteobacterium symbiont of Lucinoma myriamae]